MKPITMYWLDRENHGADGTLDPIDVYNFRGDAEHARGLLMPMELRSVAVVREVEVGLCG